MAESARILIIDPDPTLRAAVREMLGETGYSVDGAAGIEQADGPLRSEPEGIVLGWPDGQDGSRERLRMLRARLPGVPILLLADGARVADAAEALGREVDDYLSRPPSALELRARLQRLLERTALDSRIELLQHELSRRGDAERVEARSPGMRRVLDRVRRVAPLRSTVLVNGESGVGKELVARMVHFSSPRREAPFIALNCAAIPTNLIESELFGHERGAFTGAYTRNRGKFELSHRGTLFLDEIGEMDPATQAKLLRVLEQREFMRVGGDRSIRVDVRLIAATNADLEELVQTGRFRRDLYYRLKVVTIAIPPLRERTADLPALVERFLDELARENGVPRKTIVPAAMSALTAYHWPGNVRELKNLIESVLVSLPGSEIRVEDLPDSIRRRPAAGADSGLRPGRTLAEVERELIRSTLEHTGGNRTHSAGMLGIGVRTLQRKIRAYRIDIAPRRRRRRRPASEDGAEDR